MQNSFLAPLLSATSRTEVIWIMAYLSLTLRAGRVLLVRDRCRPVLELLDHAPALRLRDRPRLADADDVACLAAERVVHRVVLLEIDELAIARVLHAAMDRHRHRLLSLRRNDDTLALLLE